MPVRAASANRARNPISEPRLISAPSTSAANTPPTSATGSATNASTASRQPENPACSRRNIAIRLAMPKAMIWPVPISPPVVCFSTLAWYSSGKLTACRRSSMSLATESRLRPLTSASTSRRRETSSRWIDSGVCTTRTSATWPRRTWPPPGRSSSRLRTFATLSRVLGSPCTITSKTFWPSNTLPTVMPWSSAASARRTSPGLIW